MKQFMEVLEYTGIGYQPILAHRDWRIAILNYHPELLPENMLNFQKHMLTDESFVLLKGHCILFLAEDETLETIHSVDMEPGKLYNIKAGTFHTHTLTEDAMVLIVEGDDTCDDNSPQVFLDDAMRERMCQLTAEVVQKRAR